MAHPTASSPSRRIRQRTANPSSSRTITQTQTISIPSSGRLVLRGATNEDSTAESSSQQPPRVQWAEDVVDNENLGRKSSKVCCIYHRPHDPDGPSDSSDSSDSSSSEDDSSSSGEDLARARPAAGVRRSRARRKHHHHDHDCDGQHDDDSGDDVEDSNKTGKGKGKIEKKTINAYERMPKYTEAGRKQAEDK